LALFRPNPVPPLFASPEEVHSRGPQHRLYTTMRVPIYLCYAATSYSSAHTTTPKLTPLPVGSTASGRQLLCVHTVYYAYGMGGALPRPRHPTRAANTYLRGARF
jgi:hypothetical protein